MWYSLKLTQEDTTVGRLGVTLDLFSKHWMWMDARNDTTVYCDYTNKTGGATIYINSESKEHGEEFARILTAKPCDAPDLSSMKPLIQK